MAGVLLLDPHAASFEGGTACISVEDTSRADASALTIAETTISSLSHKRGQSERVAFALACDEPPGPRRWSVRASLDRPGTGQFTTDRVYAGRETGPLTLRLYHATDDPT